MIRRVLPLVAFAALAACGGQASSNADSVAPSASLTPVPAKDSSQTVTFGGLGLVKIGATALQLARALGDSFDGRTRDRETCRYVTPLAIPKGVSIMLVNDSVARIDVLEPGVVTLQGAGIGDSEERIKQLYAGNVKVQPHKYTGPEGHYLVVAPADEDNRLIFETDGKHVTRYRVGRRPPVEYVEGCA